MITSLKKKGPPPPYSRLRASSTMSTTYGTPLLEALCHFDVGVVLGVLLDEVAMGRIALLFGCVMR